MIGYSLVLGKPIIFWLGIIAFISLVITASIALLNKRGTRIIPFKWHPRFAFLTIAIVIVHAALALMAYV